MLFIFMYSFHGLFSDDYQMICDVFTYFIIFAPWQCFHSWFYLSHILTASHLRSKANFPAITYDSIVQNVLFFTWDKKYIYILNILIVHAYYSFKATYVILYLIKTGLFTDTSSVLLCSLSTLCVLMPDLGNSANYWQLVIKLEITQTHVHI